jgi:hypothetical protein
MHGLLSPALGAALSAVSILLLVPVAFFFLQVFAARSGLMPMCPLKHTADTIRFPDARDFDAFECLLRTLRADPNDGSVVNLARAANLKEFVHIRTSGERV